MNSDEMRPILQKRLLEDSKHCQLKQIQDKQKQREMERDEDRMWFEINKRVNTELVSFAYNLNEYEIIFLFSFNFNILNH